MPSNESLLTLLLILPLAGSLVVLLLPGARISLIRTFTLAVSALTFLLSVLLMVRFDSQEWSMQFVLDIPWFDLAGLQVRYSVGIDGISLLLVLLTTLLMPLAILASSQIKTRVSAYMSLMLMLEAGMIGVFIALDMVLFYVFWEAMLIPMYFIIGIWGGERRIYAAVKFFLYTAIGSLFMLAAIISLFFMTGSETFDIVALTEVLSSGQIRLSGGEQIFLFLAFFIAFAIKVPLFPLHTWLPDAHVEAPTAGSVILAGVLLKMGTYGLLRFCLPLFPEAAVRLAPFISVLAIVGILYGALVAMVQSDVKRLVAYSSVSHLGLVVLGIFSFNFQSMEGAAFQMLNHGISTGALFLLVGMIYDRRHTRAISDFGGLAQVMPVYSVFFMIIMLSSIGLPGLNGFVGEFLILQGTFLASPAKAALSSLGIILSAVYMLWMYQRVFMGKVHESENRNLLDLHLREVLVLAPLVLLALWMGLYSSSFLRPMDLSVRKILLRIEQAQQIPTYQAYHVGN